MRAFCGVKSSPATMPLSRSRRREDFTPQKARILLMLTLSATNDVGEVQRTFQTY